MMPDHSPDAATPASALAPVPAPAPTRRARWPVLLALIFAAGGAAWLALPATEVSTDDAFLRADDTVVAPLVKGRVAALLVRDHQRVPAGAPLVQLDDADLAAQSRAAEAELLGARANVAAARAALASLAAEEKLADAHTRTVATGIEAARAREARADAEQARHEQLALAGAVARRELELAHTLALDASAERERSEAMLTVSRRQAALTRSKRGTLAAALAQAEAAVARAAAALALAQREQGYALIRAPVDGVVGALQVQRGDYVQPGSAMLTLVPLDRLYALAYFKETHSARLVAGQTVTLAVDALRGQVLRGHVESFAPGTGSQFSLLPFEPGTGNFTKIVQRVPVRIAIEAGQETLLARLRPGLSLTATVELEQ